MAPLRWDLAAGTDEAGEPSGARTARTALRTLPAQGARAGEWDTKATALGPG